MGCKEIRLWDHWVVAITSRCYVLVRYSNTVIDLHLTIEWGDWNMFYRLSNQMVWCGVSGFALQCFRDYPSN